MNQSSFVDLSGRILLLSQSLDALRAQLAGNSLDARAAGPLRDDVSTDEITPVPILTHYDDRLGDYALTGFTVEGQRPIGAKLLRESDISILVGGKRYGKGSSREHSPAAERYAGIQLVIAESFERIYRQNADNIGLFTSTDLGLVDRIRAGDAISIEELTRDRDPVSAQVLRAGGLLRFGLRHLNGLKPAQALTNGPRTVFEKIIARHVLATEISPSQPVIGAGVFVAADWRFIHEYYTGKCAHMLDTSFGDSLTLSARDRIVAFEDHTSYVHESPVHVRGGLVANVNRMVRAHRDFVERWSLRSHRTLTDDDARRDDGTNVAGISHAMMAEHYALPGQVVVGTDSHTPHSGALGCVAFGVGTTDMANAFVTGAVRLTVPPCIRVLLDGERPEGTSAKDIVLHLLALPDIRAGAGVGKVFEFTGPVIALLDIDERATLTNMCAELGGLTGIVAPDARTQAFLRQRRGVEFELEPWMCSDADATYAQTIGVDCSELGPMLAAPGDPGRGLPLASLREAVRIDIAYGGSCTAGKREDFDRYHEVLHWAAARGHRVAANVHFYLQYGTTAVRDYCRDAGYTQAFDAVGAQMLQPSCGACANCGPGSSTDSDQVTISAINRNFPGRSGPGKVWLASPATVAASAIAGEIISFEELRRRIGNNSV